MAPESAAWDRGAPLIAMTSHEARQNWRRLLDLVRGGQSVTITFRGRPVAVVAPVKQEPTAQR